jgi:hypothetical protein
VAQHRTLVGPNEATCQGRRRHTIVTCDFVGFHLSGRRAPRCSVVQVCNERGLPGRAVRAEGLGGDQVGPRRGPHAQTIGTQVGAVAVVQRGQGGRQTRLLACIFVDGTHICLPSFI